MIKVLIVDDHAIVRRGIREIVEEIPEVLVVDEAVSGRKVNKMMTSSEYDLILLDIAMPGENGLEILRQIRKNSPKISVIMLSMYSEEHYVFRALNSGANGFVTKDNTPEELRDAIRKVMAGGIYVSPNIEENTGFDLKSRPEVIHEGLSNREFQVMTMIGSGKSVSEIAKELCLSVKTVSTHRANILMKMKMKNNSEIIHYAINEGLLK